MEKVPTWRIVLDVRIEKFNEVYLRIKCETSIAKELSEFFKFEVPNARFMPSVRNRMWSGYIHLFSPATGKIYVGLFPYVKKFCEEQGYEVEVVENEFYGWPDVDHNVPKSQIKQFVNRISKGIDVRNYQIEAIQHIINSDRGIILSPTGSGKSFIIYALVRYYVDKFDNDKILIIVPTTSLVEQMFTDFSDYGWFPEHHCHKLYAGLNKETDREVVISTWQSIYQMPKSWFKQFGAAIVDECHLAKAKSLTGIMQKLHDCKYRIGTTGTLDGAEIHQLVLEGLFGRCEQVTTTSELIESKHLSNLHIRCLVLEHPKEKRQRRPYDTELDFLSLDEARNSFIAKLVNYETGNTLVLCRYITQLDKIIDNLNDSNRPIYKVFGKTPVDDREEIRRLVEEGENVIVIASYGVFSTGINIKRLHNIVFGSPYKSQIKVLQSIGRGLRVADDKQQLNVFDIIDDLSYNGKDNYTLKHFGERINIYNEQGFDYDIIPVKLKR